MLQARTTYFQARVAFSPLPSSEPPTLQLRNEVKRQAQERLDGFGALGARKVNGC